MSGEDPIGEPEQPRSDRRLTGRQAIDVVRRGDWYAAAVVAGPTVLVAAALSLVSSLYLLWLDDGDSSPIGHSAAGYLHSSFQTMAMAFGSPIFSSFHPISRADANDGP